MATILNPNRVQIGSAGHYWSTYQCIAEEAHTPEDAQAAEYWAHVAASRRLRVNDIFEVRSETGAWALNLMVTDVVGRACRVVATWVYLAEAPEVQAEALASVKVEYKGPVKKHCIIRCADLSVLKEGIGTKADAMREALEYEQRLAV